MENVYIQLKASFVGSGNVNELFTKAKVDTQKSKQDIYREIAFGEMPISHDKAPAEQR